MGVMLFNCEIYFLISILSSLFLVLDWVFFAILSFCHCDVSWDSTVWPVPFCFSAVRERREVRDNRVRLCPLWEGAQIQHRKGKTDFWPNKRGATSNFGTCSVHSYRESPEKPLLCQWNMLFLRLVPFERYWPRVFKSAKKIQTFHWSS